MDWTKAKSILILALIFTNLVLLGTYLFQNDRFGSDEKMMQVATIKLLEEKNIFVETEIPERQKKRMPKLTVQYDTLNEELIQEKLAGLKPLPPAERSEDNLIDMTDRFLEECGLMTENVTFDSIHENGSETSIRYKNYIDGIAIEESHIICDIQDGRITKLSRYWLNPVEVNDTDKEVIPAAAALIKFMSENTEEEKIHVQDISLVYWLDSSVFDAESPVTDTAFPAWKITYNGGKIHHILAWEQ